jgi:hypothetical protein
MNRYARCSQCAGLYRVATITEKKDPGRVCSRCYVTQHQRPLDFLEPLRGREGRTAKVATPTADCTLPAANAAGSFNSGKE